MILISHRGNLNGPLINNENKPEYIDQAIKKGYDVEIDIWFLENELYLGHDIPTYKTSLDWLENRCLHLWIHCKNVEAFSEFRRLFLNNNKFNFFWHETDTAVLTSLGFIWAYPGKQPIELSIAVMPEIEKDNIEVCVGICSDYISNY
jgi:hypothetical protein